jgi:outer membrane protein
MTNWKIKAILLVFGGMRAILAGQSANPPSLTLAEAKAMALKNHPQVLESQAMYLRADQVTRETRSAYFPTLNGDLTASQAEVNSLIGAGTLTDSGLFNHVGAGVTLAQLITDGGRTRNLVANSNLRAQASRQDYQAARYDVVLAVDQAYYEVLLAEQLVNVARQTGAARQAVVDQVSELTRNKLKSEVDLSFAQVNLADAKLMLLRAKDRLNSAYAQLAQTLGTQQDVRYQLREEPMPPNPPEDGEALIAKALENRPELASVRLQTQAAQKFVEAERDLKRPNVNLIAVGGALPYIERGNATAGIPKTYEGAVINVQIPIFNGFLFSARRQAAEYQLQEEEHRTRDLRDRVARDVRTAYERTKTNFEAIAATQQLLTQANLAMSLAQGRYDLGLASIVELTQAQLGQTSAQVQNLSARYEYQASYAALQYTLGLLH